MDFQQVVNRRRMVRQYTPDRLPPATVERLVNNATRAPSAGFSQGWSFLVLDARADVDRFWSAATPPQRTADPDSWLTGMSAAPLVIVPFSSKDAYVERYAESDKGWTDRREARWPVPYWHIDTGMASLLILLTAVDEHLGACFFGIPVDRVCAVCDEFGVPDEWTPIGAITVGYPAADERPGGSPRTRRRKPSGEVVHRGHWSRNIG